MEIQRATADDWEAARDIRLRALREAPSAFCSTYEGELGMEAQSWRDRLARSATFLAWEDGETVGTVAGTTDPHEEGGRELVAMWIDPSARRAGVAEVLIDAVTTWANAQGSKSLALWVAEDNLKARRFYEKCGFVSTGEREAMRPGVEQVRMRKPLDPNAKVIR